MTYVSRPFLVELGYPMEMAERVTRLDAFRDYMEPEEMPHLSRLLDEWRTLPEARLRQDEYRLRHADGTIRSFAGRELAFARHPDGSVRQIIGSLVDITERKQAEAALRESHATLEQRVQERTAELSRAHRDASVQAEQLRSLASELTLVEQRERVRLAELIHDGLQQLLVAAKLRVNLLGRGADPAVRQSCQEIGRLLEEALADSRSLTAELSPPILRTGGLRAGLEWLARWSQEKHHLTVQVAGPGGPAPAPARGPHRPPLPGGPGAPVQRGEVRPGPGGHRDPGLGRPGAHPHRGRCRGRVRPHRASAGRAATAAASAWPASGTASSCWAAA